MNNRFKPGFRPDEAKKEVNKRSKLQDAVRPFNLGLLSLPKKLEELNKVLSYLEEENDFLNYDEDLKRKLVEFKSLSNELVPKLTNQYDEWQNQHYKSKKDFIKNI